MAAAPTSLSAPVSPAVALDLLTRGEAPEGLHVAGSLSLHGLAVARLPDRLRVDGALSVAGCRSLERLPDGLTVGRVLSTDRIHVAGHVVTVEGLPERLVRSLHLGRRRLCEVVDDRFAAPGTALGDAVIIGAEMMDASVHRHASSVFLDRHPFSLPAMET